MADIPKRPWFLQAWRKKRGLSQEQLAEMVETSKGYISDLEKGDRRYNQDLLERFAAALQCQPRDLLAHPDVAEPPPADSEEDLLRAEFRAASKARKEQILRVVKALKDTGS